MWPFKHKKQIDDKNSIDTNKPVTNPGLKLAIHTFNSKKTENNLQRVISELQKANFLVLMDRSQLKTSETSEKGIVTYEAGSIISFLNTFDEKGNTFTPLFTDWKEVNLWIKVTKDISGWIMPTEEAFNFVLKSEVEGLVINPCSDRWSMGKPQIHNFLKEIK